jgi:hypothetical protein
MRDFSYILFKIHSKIFSTFLTDSISTLSSVECTNWIFGPMEIAFTFGLFSHQTKAPHSSHA